MDTMYGEAIKEVGGLLFIAKACKVVFSVAELFFIRCSRCVVELLGIMAKQIFPRRHSACWCILCFFTWVVCSAREMGGGQLNIHFSLLSEFTWLNQNNRNALPTSARFIFLYTLLCYAPIPQIFPIILLIVPKLCFKQNTFLSGLAYCNIQGCFYMQSSR